MEQIKNLKATTQKNYYGKAKIIENENEIILKSYETNVCKIDKKTNNFIKLWHGYSKTTLNHINDFRKLYNFNILNKKDWDAIQTKNNTKKYIVIGSNGFVNHKTQVIFDDYDDAENYAVKISNGFWSYWVEQA